MASKKSSAKALQIKCPVLKGFAEYLNLARKLDKATAVKDRKDETRRDVTTLPKSVRKDPHSIGFVVKADVSLLLFNLLMLLNIDDKLEKRFEKKNVKILSQPLVLFRKNNSEVSCVFFANGYWSNVQHLQIQFRNVFCMGAYYSLFIHYVLFHLAK